jgi:hypothetical protein
MSEQPLSKQPLFATFEQIVIAKALAERDFVLLTNVIRSGVQLSPACRELLADGLLGLLAGELKRPPHRPRVAAGKSQRMVTRVVALEKENWPRKAAIAKVAEEFKHSPRWVSGVLSEERRTRRIAKEIEKLLVGEKPEDIEKAIGKVLRKLIWPREVK